ncbi:MAG TPA: hypothetical protein PK867_10165 [Pirellulales bacterium]|nr:hypothetical protein [Pirellulales bacterium]
MIWINKERFEQVYSGPSAYDDKRHDSYFPAALSSEGKKPAPDRPGGAAADWLRVQTLEPPDRVVRTFSYSGRSATHVFYFHGRPRSSLVNDRLLLTTKKDLVRDAIAVDKAPLRVTVE